MRDWRQGPLGGGWRSNLLCLKSDRPKVGRSLRAEPGHTGHRQSRIPLPAAECAESSRRRGRRGVGPVAAERRAGARAGALYGFIAALANLPQCRVSTKLHNTLTPRNPGQMTMLQCLRIAIGVSGGA